MYLLLKGFDGVMFSIVCFEVQANVHCYVPYVPISYLLLCMLEISALILSCEIVKWHKLPTIWMLVVFNNLSCFCMCVLLSWSAMNDIATVLELIITSFACSSLMYHVNRLAMHEESTSRRKVDDEVQEGAVPAYLLDRENTTRAKVSCWCILFDSDLYNIYTFLLGFWHFVFS